jgi:hypothetical protein
MKHNSMHAGYILIGTLAFFFPVSISAAAPAMSPTAFASSEEAAQALIKASEANDTTTLLQLFAPNGKDLVETGDPAEDKQSRAQFAELAHKKMALVPDPASPDRIFISVGDQDWPFPVPLIQKDGKWLFDSSEGAKEVLARRIGTHELTAIEICRGYVEAQNQYAQTHLSKGIPEYAQKIVSSLGKEDGLYWEPKKGAPPCPVPDSFAKAAHRMLSIVRRPYHGYYFRILTAQGPAAHGGAANYVANGAMTGGFALVAWPAEYGETGVQTFMVNQEGTVYQKDLGPKTSKIASSLTEFNPDNTWQPVPAEE